MARAVPSRQTLYVLTQQHERFYAENLAQVPTSRIIVQTANRGTLPAILCSLARLIQLNGEGFDSQAVVGFFPSDHFYSRGRTFIKGVRAAFKGVRAAFKAAESNAESVILLGAEAKIPETNFGYIEPAPAIEGRATRRLMSVERFWEKPSLELAHTLVTRSSIELLNQCCTARHRMNRLNLSTSRLPRLIFSNVVLSAGNPRLTVMSLGDVGWRFAAPDGSSGCGKWESHRSRDSRFYSAELQIAAASDSANTSSHTRT